MKEEKKKLKDCMNKETLDIFGQYLNRGNQIIMSKSRQTGKSDSIMNFTFNWKNLNYKYESRLSRKETIKRLFNI